MEEETVDEMRYGAALIVVILGLFLIGLLAWLLPVQDVWSAETVIALVGTLTTFLGTIVGGFLGVQDGASGKQKSEEIAHRALAALQQVEAARVLRGE